MRKIDGALPVEPTVRERVELRRKQPRMSRQVAAQMAVPRHLGMILDGNRRWAVERLSLIHI